MAEQSGQIFAELNEEAGRVFGDGEKEEWKKSRSRRELRAVQLELQVSSGGAGEVARARRNQRSSQDIEGGCLLE